MSKCIDFFEDFTKREKEIYKALPKKNDCGLQLIYCELEDCWLTEESCIKRQNKQIKVKYQNYEFDIETKCDECQYSKVILKKHGIKKVLKFKTAKNKKLDKERRCIKCGKVFPFTIEFFPKTAKGNPSGNFCKKCVNNKTREKGILDNTTVLVKKTKTKRIVQRKKDLAEKNRKMIQEVLNNNPVLRLNRKSRLFVQEETGLSYSRVCYYMNELFKDKEKIKGVTWNDIDKKWRARCSYKGIIKNKMSSSFDDAVMIRYQFEKELYDDYKPGQAEKYLVSKGLI